MMMAVPCAYMARICIGLDAVGAGVHDLQFIEICFLILLREESVHVLSAHCINESLVELFILLVDFHVSRVLLVHRIRFHNKVIETFVIRSSCYWWLSCLLVLSLIIETQSG
jgi:hypothetical protein